MNVQTDTAVPLPDPHEAFARMRAHLVDKGVEPEVDSDGLFVVSFMGNSIRMSATPTHLAFALRAQSENALYFLREAVAEHVAELHHAAADALRWSGGEVAAPLPPNFRSLSVVRRTDVIPGLHRLELTGDRLDELVSEGLHVKLMLPARRDRRPVWPGVAANGRTLWPRGKDRLHVRYFTIAAVAPEIRRLWIDVVQHAGGRVADWAVGAQPGDEIGVMGPGGGTPPSQPGPLLLVADMTGLPAVARIIAARGPAASGRLIVTAPDDDSLARYLPPHRMQVTRLDTETFAAQAPHLIAQALGDAPVFVWVAAEHTVADAARDLTRTMPKDAKEIVAYWKRGVRGDATRHED